MPEANYPRTLDSISLQIPFLLLLVSRAFLSLLQRVLLLTQSWQRGTFILYLAWLRMSMGQGI